MSRLLLVTACACAVLGLASLLLARGAARRRRWQRTVAGGLVGLLFMTVFALLAVVSVAIRGYRAPTHEEVAATVRTVPIGAQHFRASMTYPDRREEIFDIRGDAIYVDAHILKWRPWVNLLGLHTVYELSRVTGRYDELADERGRPRTVFSLGRPKPFDLFNVVRRFGRLSLLVDAEYGSATFVTARGRAAYEILVSTSGLLARPPEHLERLRNHGLSHKRSLALREYALGLEALYRLTEGEPLYRVHECVGVLALESEPVDPRL